MSELFDGNLFHEGGSKAADAARTGDGDFQDASAHGNRLDGDSSEEPSAKRTASSAQVLGHSDEALTCQASSLINPLAKRLDAEIEDPLESFEGDELADHGLDGLGEGFEFGAETLEQEKVLGPTDTRQRIAPGASFYFPVCQILTTFTGTNKETVGSGVLVTPSVVLTAGHNFIKPGRRCTSVRVNFLMYSPSGGHFRLAENQLSRVRVANGYNGESDRSSAAFDYAAIRLPGKVTAFDPLRVMPTTIDPQPGSDVIVAGYPLKAAGPANGDHLYASRNTFVRTVPVTQSRRSVSHRVDTSRGQSGGPIIYVFGGPNGEKVARVIGIHNKFGRIGNSVVNLGAYLRGSVLNEIKSWI